MIRHTVHILNVDIFEVLEIFQLHLPVQCFIITSFFQIHTCLLDFQYDS